MRESRLLARFSYDGRLARDEAGSARRKPVSRMNQIALGLVAGVAVSACASTSFISTWKAPDAAPIGSLDGRKVLAMVLAKDTSVRRAAEDTLATELTTEGATGVPSYTLISDEDVNDEAKARKAVEAAGVEAVVVLRPVGQTQEIRSTPTYVGPTYGPRYGPFWGGYYGYGWGAAYAPDIRTYTIVNIETLLYSISQNKLNWAGQTKTTNPQNVSAFVREVVKAASKELKKQGLL